MSHLTINPNTGAISHIDQLIQPKKNLGDKTISLQGGRQPVQPPTPRHPIEKDQEHLIHVGQTACLYKEHNKDMKIKP